jgi:hypothetical protein
MPSSRRPSQAMRRLSLTAVGVVLAILPFLAQTASQPADPMAKLSTVLADLTRAVPQQRGPAGTAARPLSREALPAAVRDAMHGRHLRMNPADEACGFAGAGAEGTALLEIVHDLAPGAQLAFANADTDLAFNQAVNFLAAVRSA